MHISLNDNQPTARLVPSPSTGTFELRRLGPRDLASLAAYYLSLDPTERANRFHTAINDLGILSYLNRIDFSRATLIGAIDWVTATIIGVVEVHMPTDDAPAELALSVDTGPRAALAATQLMNEAFDAAAVLGADSMIADFNPDDRMTERLLREFGASINHVNCQATMTWSERKMADQAA